MTLEERLVAVRPSPRQLAWQALEFYGFLHFGMNTMTDREWGLGRGRGGEDPGLFNPAELDADQWMRALKAAGMRGVILTAKHHDGFCLWPSRVTDHTVAASPWRGGRGDVVREAADAAARHGLKFGVYLSPWDRTEPSYGSGAAYDDFYVAQLTELLTGYGPIFCVWLDGANGESANGEGPNGKTQQYDWERYYATIRRLQPDAVISVCGPDVRWVGNEAGATRANEWSVVPAELRDVERIAAKSQQVDDGAFRRMVTSADEDLGSRRALEGYRGELIWYPAEVNMSIRPGWFYHPAEDDEVRSPDELFELYLRAVGGNACLLLNVPPRPDGLLAPADVAALEGLGERVRELEERRLAASVMSASPRDFVLVLDGGPSLVDAVVVREHIAEGQRVEHVVVSGALGRGGWQVLAETDAVGYQRIVRFAPREVDRLRLEVTASRGEPVIARLWALRPARPLGKQRAARP
ncbi:alpha-L-fucosidase [Gryllotalpicola ginsengisoli]|uniref:alpha-L-fucosidase n=1 Tax=Gryllotalpicola ginsengisoli TaxID=444608 RepID=UPI0003B6DF1F|nr:alpha-L-fucosidase [Gryllotalpicola ginsengisoli]